MQRKFITNLGFLLLLNLLIKPFWIFGIDIPVQNELQAEEYGMYFALFNFSMFFHIVLDLGLTIYNTRSIAQNSHLLSKYFSGIVAFKLLLAIVYFLITFIFGYLAGYDSDRFYILLFLTINQFLLSFIAYFRSNIAGLQMFTLNSFLSVLDRSLMIILCGGLLLGNFMEIEFTLMRFIYAQTLAYVLTALVVFILVLYKAEKFTLKIDLPFLWLMIKQTLPYAVLVLTMTFYYRMDVVMLDLMLEDGEIQAAIYAKPYRLMDAFNQVGVLFAGLLLPMFAFMIKKKEKVNELVQLSFSLLFMPAIVLAVISIFFSNSIIEALFDSHVGDAAKILPVLMLCFVAISTTYIYGTLLTANGSLLLLNRLAIGGLFVNFFLNYLFIPNYQGYGSAIATLVTQVLIVAAQMIVVKKLFNIAVNFKYILTIILFILLVVLIVYGVKMYISKLAIQLLLSASLSIALGIILRLIDLKKIIKTVVSKGE